MIPYLFFKRRWSVRLPSMKSLASVFCIWRCWVCQWSRLDRPRVDMRAFSLWGKLRDELCVWRTHRLFWSINRNFETLQLCRWKYTNFTENTNARVHCKNLQYIYMLIAKKNGNEEWRRKVRGGPSIYNVKRATICCVRRILLAARYMYIRYDLQAINVIPSPVQLIIADRDNGKMQTL